MSIYIEMLVLAYSQGIYYVTFWIKVTHETYSLYIIYENVIIKPCGLYRWKVVNEYVVYKIIGDLYGNLCI